MEDLIQALQVFIKYDSGTRWPTHCEHDILMVVDIPEDKVSDEDKTKLDELGFSWNDEYDCWASARFGSA